MGFVGLARNEETFQPEAYMASLPESLVDRDVFVLDPMLATGGSLVHCCGLLTARGATSITVLCALAAPEGIQPAGGERPAAAGVHRQRRRGAQRQGLHRPGPRRRGRPPVRRGLTMRFGVLGTGFWAQEVHAAGARRAPGRRAGRRLGPRPRQGQGAWARSSTSPASPTSTSCWPRWTPSRSRCRRTCRRRWPIAARPRPASTCCWRSRSRSTSPTPTGWSPPCATPGSRRSSSSPSGSSAATSTWLTQAARTELAGGAGSWLGLARRARPFDASPWREEHGALWDIGPHALSLLVPGARAGRRGAGRRRAARHRAPGAAPTSRAPPRR